MSVWLLRNGRIARETGITWPPFVIRGRVEGCRGEGRWSCDGRLLGFFDIDASEVIPDRLPIPDGTADDWQLIRLMDGSRTGGRVDKSSLAVTFIGGCAALLILAVFFMNLVRDSSERMAIEKCYQAGGICSSMPNGKCACSIPASRMPALEAK